MEIKLDFDTKKLMSGFVDIKRANLLATKATLDTMAALTRKNAIKNLNSNFINRSKFTEKQMQFMKSEGEIINKLESRAGATQKASYMELQEKGGIHRPKKGSRLALPSDVARGGSKIRKVRIDNYLRKVTKKRVKGKFQKRGTKKSRAVAMAYVANREHKFIKNKDGYYAHYGFHKISKSRVVYQRRRLYNTKMRSVNVPKNPWLEPATKKPINDAQAIFNSQIKKLLKLPVM